MWVLTERFRWIVGIENLFEEGQSEDGLDSYYQSSIPTAREHFPWLRIVVGTLGSMVFLGACYGWACSQGVAPQSTYQLRGAGLVAQLQAGSPVCLSGVEIGRVTGVQTVKGSAQLSAESLASISFHDGFNRRLPSDTRFEIRSLSGKGRDNLGVVVVPGRKTGSELPKVLLVDSDPSLFEDLENLTMDSGSIARGTSMLWAMRFSLALMGLLVTSLGFVYRMTRMLVTILVALVLIGLVGWMVMQYIPADSWNNISLGFSN